MEGATISLVMSDGNQASLFKALDARFSAARVLGVGESSHQTHEIAAFKAAWALHLVKRGDVATVALEANFAAVARANAFAQGEPGTAGQAARNLAFPIYWSQAMEGFLHALRAHNAALPATQRVQLVGIDVQDPDSARGLAVSALRASGIRVGITAPPGVLTRALDRHRKSVRARLGDDGWAIARRAAELSQRTQRSERDEGLARSVQWALSRTPPGKKVFVWAHDAHVVRGSRMMGDFLKSALGETYGVVAIILGQGQMAKGTGRFGESLVIPPPPRGSVEQELQAACARPCAVTWGPEPGWAWRQFRVRRYGMGATAPFLAAFTPAADADAIVFIPEVTPQRETANPVATEAVNLRFGEGPLWLPPAGWWARVPPGAAVFVRRTAGERAVVMELPKGLKPKGALLQDVRTGAMRGQRVRLRARIACDCPKGTEVQLGLAPQQAIVSGGGAPPPKALQQVRAGVPGPYEVTIAIPKDSTSLQFGVVMHGAGTVTVADVSLKVQPSTEGATP